MTFRKQDQVHQCDFCLVGQHFIVVTYNYTYTHHNFCCKSCVPAHIWNVTFHLFYFRIQRLLFAQGWLPQSPSPRGPPNHGDRGDYGAVGGAEPGESGLEPRLFPLRGPVSPNGENPSLCIYTKIIAQVIQ